MLDIRESDYVPVLDIRESDDVPVLNIRDSPEYGLHPRATADRIHEPIAEKIDERDKRSIFETVVESTRRTH